MQRVAQAGPRVAPHVDGVDRKPLVGIGGLHQLADEARRRVRRGKEAEQPLRVAARHRRIEGHAERQHQQRQRADPDRQRGQHAQWIAAARVRGVGGSPEQVALDADDGDDRDEEGELELHQQSEHRPKGGDLGPAAAERVDRGQQDERADRVDLPPHRRVEDDAGIEEVDRGRHDPQRLGPHPRRQRGSPSASDHEQEPRHADVGRDTRDLHQAAGRIQPDDRLQQSADGAEHPEDVQVAGRIIAEVALLVEMRWSEAC